MPFENIVGRAEIIFFSVGDGERGLGSLALAVGGALGPVVHDRAMRRARRPAERACLRGHGSGYQLRRTPTLLERGADPYARRSPARNRAGSYQRLEFLGDHVLGLVVADMLFRAFPEADEGELSRRLRRPGAQGEPAPTWRARSSSAPRSGSGVRTRARRRG